MAVADAVFDGATRLEGVATVRVDNLRELGSFLAARSAIPVLVTEFAEVLTAMTPDVLVDARMRKRARPEVQRGLAPLTIGLGPNFVAGVTTDVVVETSWEQLGQVLTRGSSLPLRGEPRTIAGHPRDRDVYAPIAGTFETTHQIGDRVAAGETVARVDSVPLSALLDGVLRGLTRNGVPVSAKTKVIEIDPRGDPDLVGGIGERPARTAEGVVRVLVV
jgi:xanthine dehydrogenase accessory factor